MTIKIEIEVPNTYTKGCCYDCPFSYSERYEEDEEWFDYEDFCVLGCDGNNCPVEIIEK